MRNTFGTAQFVIGVETGISDSIAALNFSNLSGLVRNSSAPESRQVSQLAPSAVTTMILGPLIHFSRMIFVASIHHRHLHTQGQTNLREPGGLQRPIQHQRII